MPQHAAIQPDGSAPGPLGGPRVRDVMRRDFITISREESLLEALHVMRLARLRHVAVVSGSLLVGVLSYRDLQDELLASFDLESVAASTPAITGLGVAERVHGSPFSIVPDATLAEAAARLDRLRVGCLPVVVEEENGPRLVGILTEMDLLRAAYRV